MSFERHTHETVDDGNLWSVKKNNNSEGLKMFDYRVRCKMNENFQLK